MNLRVALEQRASLKKLNVPPTDSSPQHYKLTMEGQSEKGAGADSGGNGESDVDVSAEQAHSKEHSKVDALTKEPASPQSEGRPGMTDLSSKPGVSPVPTFSVREKRSPSYAIKGQGGDSTLHVEDEGDNVDYDNNFESSGESEVDPVVEDLFDSDREKQQDRR